MNTTAYQTRDAFAEALVRFLNEELPLLHPRVGGHGTFTRDCQLFEEGGIDSLGIVQIVHFVETALGHELPLQDVHMRNFRTAGEIATLFWLRTNL